MSHIRIKTKYLTEGNYGSIDENTLFCHHNNCSDYVSFYYEDGTHILTVPDTIDNNILEAINRLYNYYNPNSENKLNEYIEFMAKEDISKI